MATSIGVLDYSFIAEGDLSGSQYCAVTLGTAAGSCKICGVSDMPIGILQNKPTAGQEATVRLLGTSVVKANGAYAKGDMLAVVAATGKADTAVPGANLWVLGQALYASGATNDEIEITVSIAPLTITLASLSAVADGASGADQIGATAITELGAAATGQSILEALAAQKVRGSVLSIPVSALSKIANNGLPLNAFTPRFSGKIAALAFATGLTPATTAAKDIDLQCLIGAVPTTGGVLTLLTADVDAIGKVKAATAITGANTFSATDTISIKCVEQTAAFVEGEGVLLVTLLPA